jgi:hypothetical protein
LIDLVVVTVPKLVVMVCVEVEVVLENDIDEVVIVGVP